MKLSLPTADAFGEATLANQVASRLGSCGHSPLRNLQVIAEPDAIVLQGTVPSFYLKQMAQVLAKTVNGVALVVNETVVNRVSNVAPVVD